MKKINISLILLLISIVLLSVSFYYLKLGIDTQSTIVTSKATITEIDTNNLATIEYEVNDQKYQKQITVNNKGINEDVTIYYNKNNPDVLISKPNIIKEIIMTTISSLLFIYFLINTIKDSKKNKRIKLLKATGIYIEAIIEEVIVNGKGKPKKGKYPYRVRCIYTNPNDKSVFKFESEDLYFKVNEYINEYNIKKVPIYVDKTNYKNYYIDVLYAKNKGVK